MDGIEGWLRSMPKDMLNDILRLFQHLTEQYKKAIMAVGFLGATKSFHKYIDSNVVRYDVVAKSTCKRGCSFCCYLHVAITEGEAEILAQHVTPQNLGQLHKQRGKDDVESFMKLPIKDRACAFLVNGECSVYVDRPASCRKYYVANKPEDCNTEHRLKGTKQIAIPELEMATGVLMTQQKHGSFATLILKKYVADTTKAQPQI